MTFSGVTFNLIWTCEVEFRSVEKAKNLNTVKDYTKIFEVLYSKKLANFEVSQEDHFINQKPLIY